MSLHLLGASAAVEANAHLYCQIRIWSAPAALANYVVLGYLLGRQRARTALALQVVINLVNVAVALWMVLHLGRGVAGIATATLSADWAGLLAGLALIRLGWPRPGKPTAWRKLLNGPSLRRLFALNRDILLRTVSLVAAYAWFTRTGARLGDATLAANAVLLNLHMIASYGLDGFANATEALVGDSVGAGRRADYHAVLKASTVVAVGVAAAISLLYLAIGAQILHFFTNQQAVLDAARRYLPWAVVLPIASVFGYQMDGVFIGATRARELRDSMVLSLAGFLLLLNGRWQNALAMLLGLLAGRLAVSRFLALCT